RITQQAADLRDANAKLSVLALTDGLTGLYNRRAFMDVLGRTAASAKRSSEPYSLVLLDVDRFKAYNDDFGHPEGGALLVALAKLLSSARRESDCVARFGGEEFALILPATALDGAAKVAEAVRRRVEQNEWPQRQVTASFGVACSLEASGRQALIGLADQR